VAGGAEGPLSGTLIGLQTCPDCEPHKLPGYCGGDIDLRKATGMAAQKRPAQQSVNISTVGSKEIVLIVLAMVVLAGAAISVTLLG